MSVPITYKQLVEALEKTRTDPAYDRLNAELYDGEDDDRCRICGAVEGTSDYGTAGDGFDGMCPSCADATEPEEEE